MSSKNLLNSSRLKRPSYERLVNLSHCTPYQALQKTIKEHTYSTERTSGVVHWFRDKDLRVEDNKALYHAMQKAKKTQKPLIALYLYCPHSLIFNGISKARIDFLLETLKELQKSLNQLNIPFVIIEIDQFKKTHKTLSDFCKQYTISDLYANYEYEVNELRRDKKVFEKIGSQVNVFYYHDQCSIEPCSLTNGKNQPIQVFTYYYKQWVQLIKQSPHLIDTCPQLTKQTIELPKNIAQLLDNRIPKIPNKKQFECDDDKEFIRKLWPAGHKAALKKLDYFIEHHLDSYTDTRNKPGLESTSKLSAYLSIGAISPRTILKKIAKCNKNSYHFEENSTSKGIFGWVREIVFREFYKDQLVHAPHISMNFPQNPKFAWVHWREDIEGWKKWCEGKTGIPLIDAGMRQLNKEAYMHNRLRMNVAFYLYSVLLIDYRLGERYFADHLIDYDLANNVQGWSPNYTLFNPILQAERNDPEGHYIRKWVPELKEVKGNAIFDPYHRLSSKEFEQLGYPKPYMDWEKSKHRSRAYFKTAVRKK